MHQISAKVYAEAVPGFRLTVAPEISAATASTIASGCAPFGSSITTDDHS